MLFSSLRRHARGMHLCIMLFVSCALVWTSGPAAAADFFWAAPVSGEFLDGTKYTPPPGPSSLSDIEHFNLGSLGYTVSDPQNIVGLLPLAGIRVDNDTVTFSHIIFSTEALFGNNPGDIANVTLLNAKIDGAIVGNAAGSFATATIDASEGPASIASVDVGYGGIGTLNVINGGKANNTTIPASIGSQVGSRGTVMVSGTGSFFGGTGITIGDAGTGGISVSGAGTLTSSSAVLGGQATGRGSISVSGTGSSFQNTGGLNVGLLGAGAVSVGGTGSVFSNTGALNIGEGGSGLFSASGGATPAQSGNVVIGDLAGSTGSASIDGAGTTFTVAPNQSIASLTTVGNKGTGSLSATNGATITVDNLTVGGSIGGAGTITVDGKGTLLTQGGNSTFAIGQPGSTSANVTIQNQASYKMPGGQVIIGNSTGQNSLTFDGASGNIQSNSNTNVPLALYNGSLHVQDGAVLSVQGNSPSTSSIDIGNAPSGLAGNGQAFVDGRGSQLMYSATKLTIGTGSNDPTHSNPLATGSLTVTNSASVFGQGAMQIDTTGTLTVGEFSSLVASQLTNYGTAHLGGIITTGEVQNFGTMSVDGIMNADVKVNGGILSGTGTISGSLSLDGTIAPGDSPGTLTTGAVTVVNGSTFDFEINSALGTAGGTTGWNLLNSTGSVAFFPLPNAPLTLHLASLSPTDSPGSVTDFDPTKNYSWTFLSASGGITGFDPSMFHIDTSGFTNPVYGQFGVTEVGNSLVLSYKAPEPSTFVLAAIGALIGWGLRGRERRR
jgi:T5SS/PEP-CTERM-associated repeat protein